MNHVGPIYCETPIGETVVSFPAELVNTISNFPTIVLGILAFWCIWSKAPKQLELYSLAFLLFATGVGSTWWHGARTGISLTFDVLPGLLFLFLLIYFWAALLFGKLRGFIFLGGFLILQFLLVRYLFTSFESGGRFLVFGLVLAGGILLISLSYRKSKMAAYFGLGAVVTALTAAVMRSIDLTLCTTIPFGTHFLWHVFLGTAAFLGIMTIYHLGKSKKQELS